MVSIMWTFLRVEDQCLILQGLTGFSPTLGWRLGTAEGEFSVLRSLRIESTSSQSLGAGDSSKIQLETIATRLLASVLLCLLLAVCSVASVHCPVDGHCVQLWQHNLEEGSFSLGQQEQPPPLNCGLAIVCSPAGLGRGHSPRFLYSAPGWDWSPV